MRTSSDLQLLHTPWTASYRPGAVAKTLMPVVGLLATLLLAMTGASLATAQDESGDAMALTAQDVLDDTTGRVLAIIEEARAYVDEDPERYYEAVDSVLGPVVDYRGFARGVMGDYATSARYRSLDEAGRDKLRGQLDRFTDVVRQGLIRTYSKGLLAFGGSRVEIDDSSDADPTAKRATVKQLIYSDQSEPFVVIYQMARGKEGDWRMRNLVVENVNLGQIYRSQFESAARRFDGDLDQVIDNWNAEADF